MFESDVHAYLRAAAGDTAVRVPPFLARFDEHGDGLFFNYAVPDDGARPGPSDVRDLVGAFADRRRTPRLEYLPAAAPAVEAALLAAGFAVERRLPILTCAGTPPMPAVDGAFEIVRASDDAQLWQVARVQSEAYGMPEATAHDVARLRAVADRGGLVALAVDAATGEGAGAGQFGPPHEGVSELAGVGVRASHRRRGIAAALTAWLTREGRGAGISTPFLMPDNDGAERIYRRAGYERAAEILHISLR
ncbi:GNAT family N-acetyltransferase [Actinomadura nitritigenes]|uniref:GNAT family N-acetyltransferase n=1 Tax=Actinomadura nitritigenes TaxID=134602 RepID=A0ABS3QUN0_9ACTN|nr:GNAT family N-acetyltransferase [Actinomadura nitritigenes]MBO2437168.1 GNAT family N-acetyltransferase [Actinomadura nitritigenes]